MTTAADVCGEVMIGLDLRGADIESYEFWTHDVRWKQQYEIWRHGTDLVECSQSRQDLHAGIMQLQRAVEQRDTILKDLYRFAEMPWFSTKNQYDIMAEVGVIRPRLKRPLRELRNAVAHDAGVNTIEKSR